MKNRLLNWIWYERHWVRWLLWPFALVYQSITWVRHTYYRLIAQHRFDVPIIVVGNLTVGGVGKTPLVIVLAERFSALGLRVGIVSRGYGASIRQFPHEVDLSDAALDVGDEPLLLAKKTKCPVVIAPKRNEAVQYLLDKYQSQIIISDDGLQHYAMGRAIEIVVVDGMRGFGNGLCLPAGPLREGPSRLNKVDFIVVNGDGLEQNPLLCNAYRMKLAPGLLVQVGSGKTISWSDLCLPVTAVAGIGNPERFFLTLKLLGISFEPYAFPDHYRFQYSDFAAFKNTVVMTEKDAVKCMPFATDNMYFLPVNAELSGDFWRALYGKCGIDT
ncbi:MAG: tetraacyldisaccharide 4'-kinase [Legionellaceae bacterium]|nr:tetraacyldisaccharide 4'-kinase [Legionellaceae bacterium]